MQTLFLLDSQNQSESIFGRIASIPESHRIVLVLDPWLQQPLEERGIKFKIPSDYVKKAEFKKIHEKAVFLARNWYLFDAEIKKNLEHRGIQLGFLEELEFAGDFGLKMAGVKAVKNCIAKEKPEKIIASETSFVKKIPLKIEKELFQASGKKKGFFFNYKRYWEIRRKLKNIISGTFKSKSKKTKTVFIKGRHFLEEIKESLVTDFNVISLDELLLKNTLHPAGLIKNMRRQNFFPVWKKIRQNKKIKKELSFEGACLLKLSESFFELAFKKKISENAFAIDVLFELFEKKKPDMLVVWDDCIPFERACVLIAKMKGIPSIVIQHGIIFDSDYKIKCWLRGFAPLTADFFAAWGSESKKILTQKCVPAEKIIVTGAARFDSLLKKMFSRSETMKKLGIPENKKIVLFPSETVCFENNSYKTAENLCRAVGRIKDCVLLIKPHPTEYKDKYEKITKRFKNAIVRQDLPIHELLHAADTVVVFRSTVGLEAMALQKPVLVYNVKCFGQNPFLSFSRGAVLNKPQEIKPKIEGLLFDPEKRKKNLDSSRRFVFENAYRQDCKATKRIINLIKNIAGAKKFVLGIIPARKGSKRLENKNIIEINGKPLIAYTIEAALRAKNLDSVLVSTDSKKIANISKKFGAQIPFMRPKEFARDNASSFDVMRHAVKKFESMSGKRVDFAVLLQPTSPFRTSEQIDSAVKQAIEKKANSLFSVAQLSKNSKFPVFLKKEKLIFAKNEDKKRGRYNLNGAIFIHDREALFSGSPYPIGKKCVLFEMPIRDSIDIDTKEDFEKADRKMKKRLSK